MADFQLVDPNGWDHDLHSIYSAYLGHFQLHNIPWYERSWGVLFESFEEFLAFSWPVIVVTDSWTGRAHIVTRKTSVRAFLKMVKTRFGETLPEVDNILKIRPFESGQKHLRTVSDWSSYKKVYATLPGAVQAAFRTRVRGGEPKAIKEVWDKKDKTFLAIDFEWSERNPSSCLEWGYAAVRCGHLDAVGVWPPSPESNYRKGHYIVSEYVDKVQNRHQPTYPWQYAFGESQVISKTKLPQIIRAIISSFASPDSDTISNTLVLVAHGIHGDLTRLEEMKIKLPHNVLIIDTSTYEREMFNTGQRGIMTDAKTGKPRASGTTLSLGNLLASLKVNVRCQLHNSGNDAFLCLLGLQMLLDPENTKAPPSVSSGQSQASPRSASRSPSAMYGYYEPSVHLPTVAISASPVMMHYGGSRSSLPRPPSTGYHSPTLYDDSTQSRRSSRYSPTNQGTYPPNNRKSSYSNALTVDEMGHKRQSSGNSDSLARSVGNLKLG